MIKKHVDRYVIARVKNGCNWIDERGKLRGAGYKIRTKLSKVKHTVMKIISQESEV